MARSLDRNNFSRAVPRPFGAANWVTLIRAVIALFLLALGIGGFGQAIGAELRWVAITGALLALCLDGVDGFLARRFRQASAFGARFDLETDALTMMALALLVWATNQAGPWVLLSGLMRYIFVIGGWVWPALAMPLPPRKRRQTLCVVQMVALILALIPSVPPFWAGLFCLFGLSLLGYSFAADTVWLMNRARMEGTTA
jgi:phosphatidylglycerophosphate synthase